MPKLKLAKSTSETFINESRRPSAEDIARRAYAIYERRGRTDGSDLDDWLEAERELTNSATALSVQSDSRKELNTPVPA